MGYAPDNAEIVRRMLAKLNPEKMAKLEPELMFLCVAKGYNQQIALKIWDLLLPYTKYAVRKSLVSMYTLTAYQFAYLKVHYESEFCDALSQIQ